MQLPVLSSHLLLIFRQYSAARVFSVPEKSQSAGETLDYAVRDVSAKEAAKFNDLTPAADFSMLD